MILRPEKFAGLSKEEVKVKADQLYHDLQYGSEAPDALVEMLFENASGLKSKAIADINLKPTEAMANAAERGLRLRKEHGRGGTEVGVARARDISNRKDLSPSTVKRMKSFFARHEVDLDAPAAKEGHKDYPSAGLIAWLLWGGDPGKTWAENKVEAIDRESGKKNLKNGDNCGTGAGGFSEGNVCATGSSAAESKEPATDKAGKEIKDSRGRTVPLNNDGTMTVYLATDEETARQIAETGELPDGKVIVTTSEGRAMKKGDAVLQLRVQPKDLQIEEEVEQLFADDALFDFSVEQDAVQAEQLVPVGAAEDSKDTLVQPGTLNVKQPDKLQHNPQVDTQEFAEWFGNGVQHADGEPVQFYHGTKRNFDRLQGSERYDDSAYFLTSDPKFAGEWPSGSGGLREPGKDAAESIEKITAKERELTTAALAKVKSDFGLQGNEQPPRGPERDRYDEAISESINEVRVKVKEEFGFSRFEAESNLGIRVLPVYAAAQKTFYPPRDYKLIEPLLRAEAKQDPSLLKMMEEGHHKYGNWFLYERSGISKGVQAMGYDAIWITEGMGRGMRDHTTLAIWDSSLAKSAIGNSGEWDPKDPRLTKSADDCGTGAGGFKEGNVCATGSAASESDAKLPNNVQEFWDEISNSNEWQGMPIVEGGDDWKDDEGLDGQKVVSDEVRRQAEQMASVDQINDVKLYTGMGYNNASRYARDENYLYEMPKEHRKPAVNIVQTMDHLTGRPIDVMDQKTFIVHRGMTMPLPDSPDYDPQKTGWVKKIIDAKVGDKLKPLGFLSTTDNFGTARSFAWHPRKKETAEVVFTIEATRGLALSRSMTNYQSEKEVVLPRNGSFTVIGKEIVRNAPDVQSPQVDRTNESPIIHIKLRQDDE